MKFLTTKFENIYIFHFNESFLQASLKVPQPVLLKNKLIFLLNLSKLIVFFMVVIPVIILLQLTRRNNAIDKKNNKFEIYLTLKCID